MHGGDVTTAGAAAGAGAGAGAGGSTPEAEVVDLSTLKAKEINDYKIANDFKPYIKSEKDQEKVIIEFEKLTQAWLTALAKIEENEPTIQITIGTNAQIFKIKTNPVSTDEEKEAALNEFKEVMDSLRDFAGENLTAQVDIRINAPIYTRKGVPESETIAPGHYEFNEGFRKYIKKSKKSGETQEEVINEFKKIVEELLTAVAQIRDETTIELVMDGQKQSLKVIGAKPKTGKEIKKANANVKKILDELTDYTKQKFTKVLEVYISVEPPELKEDVHAQLARACLEEPINEADLRKIMEELKSETICDVEGKPIGISMREMLYRLSIKNELIGLLSATYDRLMASYEEGIKQRSMQQLKQALEIYASIVKEQAKTLNLGLETESSLSSFFSSKDPFSAKILCDFIKAIREKVEAMKKAASTAEALIAAEASERIKTAELNGATLKAQIEAARHEIERLKEALEAKKAKSTPATPKTTPLFGISIAPTASDIEELKKQLAEERARRQELEREKAEEAADRTPVLVTSHLGHTVVGYVSKRLLNTDYGAPVSAGSLAITPTRRVLESSAAASPSSVKTIP